MKLVLHNQDTWTMIFAYLLPSELACLTATSKYFKSDDVSQRIEQTWSFLCEKRWRLSKKARQALSSCSMKETYRIQNMRMRIPDGKFTSNHNITFGKGRTVGACAWFFIAHSPNAQLRNDTYCGNECHSIELRFCVQNLLYGIMRVPMSFDCVHVQALPGSDPSEDIQMKTSNYQIVAKNGEYCKDTGDMLLQPLEFGVFSCHVFCPTSVINEPEFITMLDKISLSLRVSDCHKLSIEHGLSISLTPHDEEQVWKHYMTLPSGVVLLRTDHS